MDETRSAPELDASIPDLLLKFSKSIMELSRTHKRVMIYYDYKKGLTYDQSHESLVKAFGDEAPSLATVNRWYHEFQQGRPTFEDEPRAGRPHESVTPETILMVENLIRTHRNITYGEIQESLEIGASSVNSILHDHLGVRKLASRWIPHLLKPDQKQARIDWCKFMLKKFDQGASVQVQYIVTGDETWIYSYDPETKQQSTVWVFEDEPPPTKVTRSRSTNKQMVAVFFRKSGVVAAVPLVERRTVNADWYCEVCLPKVFAELQKERPKAGLRRILLHHDNATAHTASKTLDFLHESEVQLVTHPAYSPDLAPCDFFLFPELKKHLRGTRYSSAEKAVEAMNIVLKDMPKKLFQDCFDDWFLRMTKCIDAKGDYFEKL